MPGGDTALTRAYGIGMRLGLPLIRRAVGRKLSEAGVAPERIAERDGRTSVGRPAGQVVWMHGVSIGESLSALPLAEAIVREYPDWHVLLTSGTASSAGVLAHRLPARTIHQFAPLDAAPAVGRFLEHWRPGLAIFIESEVWPVTLSMLADRGVPVALVNARLSARTARRWQGVPRTARQVVGRFALIHCQDSATAAVLAGLGPRAGVVPMVGPNLKAASRQVPPDASALRALRQAVGDRPVWVAASTHPGEEAEVLAAHGVLLERFGDCLLVLVPRHPERRDEVTGLVRAAGLRHGLRGAQGAPPARQDQVYVADTLGEMALWYHLGGPVFLGGSWVPVGGHNPFEPAAAGAPVLHGPLHANFDAVFAALDAAGGGRTVRDGPELAAAVTGIWRNSQMRTQMEAAALGFAADQRQSIDGLVGQVLSLVQG